MVAVERGWLYGRAAEIIETRTQNQQNSQLSRYTREEGIQTECSCSIFRKASCVAFLLVIAMVKQ